MRAGLALLLAAGRSKAGSLCRVSGARAFVGSDDGVVFAAHVEYPIDTPFPYLNGPRRAAAAAAVGWARHHAPWVLVRCKGTMYSAGRSEIPGIASWPFASEWRRDREAAAASWNVRAKATFAAACPDPDTIADLERGLRAGGVVLAARAEARDRSVVLTFQVSAADELAANEAAFEALRTAWPSIPAHAAGGCDTSSVEVEKASGSGAFAKP